MNPFNLLYTKEAKDRLRHLHPRLKQQIRLALDDLKENPWCGKPLQRELTGLFSLRVQHYRILYTIDEKKGEIFILTLGERKTIYEEFTKKTK